MFQQSRGLPLGILLCAVCCGAAGRGDVPQHERVRAEQDPEFHPVVEACRVRPKRVRPGDIVAVDFTFRNRGTRPARRDYRVFVHFEYPDKNCRCIQFQYDHDPDLPTSLWAPGQAVEDGPYVVPVPEGIPDGEYFVHVGLFYPGPGGYRLCEAYPAKVRVDHAAEPARSAGPPELSPEEAARRRKRFADRMTGTVRLNGPGIVFRVAPASGAFAFEIGGERRMWTSDPAGEGFGEAQVRGPEGTVLLPLRGFEVAESAPNRIILRRPLDGGRGARSPQFEISIGYDESCRGFRFRWRLDAAGNERWKVHSVRLFRNAFPVSAADGGAVLLPFRMGELANCSETVPGRRRFVTYNNTSMAMVGLLRADSAVLVAWPHPDTTLDVRSRWTRRPEYPGRRVQSISLTLAPQSHEVVVVPCTDGRLSTLAKAYRAVARAHGWLFTWREKRAAFPMVDKMFGAADFKPFVFSRTVPGSRFNKTGRELTHLSYTFEEAAEIAEHLHRDLEIDRALYVLAGWIHRGYDNQHPDILPACPQCGGNDKLAECASRVKACGFLFGLHDNYQDMYEDAPSWNVKHLNKRADGTPKRGGNWAGGQAWQVCAIEQVRLASRPQNLPAVKKLFAPTVYFIDTTFAWPLVTCEDLDHPMTRLDDLHWKSRLCDLAKKYFGLFGSEEGREWAVPHADYFEGLLSHKVSAARTDRGWSRTAGGRVVPFFEMVYGDCINLYTHQSDRAVPDRPDYILGCITCAENPVYAFGPHLYFKKKSTGPAPIRVSVERFDQTGPRRFSVVYRWEAAADVAADYRCFVHYTHPKGDRLRESIAFQDDHSLPRPTSTWKRGEVILDGPRTVTVPEKFNGRIAWCVGLVDASGRRIRLPGPQHGNLRRLLGTLNVTSEGRVTFRQAESSAADATVFARADNGWAEKLNPTDRFIKNTYEVTSWLNRITAEQPMTEYRLATSDGRVEFSAFGAVRTWANHGPESYEVSPDKCPGLDRLAGGPVELPQWGFLVFSPRFVAFYATRFGKTDLAGGALFTVRSLDSAGFGPGSRIRVFHGFGPSTLEFLGNRFDVESEDVLSLGK